jgi:hypothetical protein
VSKKLLAGGVIITLLIGFLMLSLFQLSLIAAACWICDEQGNCLETSGEGWTNCAEYPGNICTRFGNKCNIEI